jgi:hypothetical protein
MVLTNVAAFGVALRATVFAVIVIIGVRHQWHISYYWVVAYVSGVQIHIKQDPNFSIKVDTRA